jgi:hypothetical protein
MSALGQKQTGAPQKLMWAKGQQRALTSFDHFIGAAK